MTNLLQTRRLALAAAACLLPAAAGASPTYTMLYSFNGSSDGAFPQSRPIEDAQGNLYGTAAAGGIQQPSVVGPQYGVVFEVKPGGAQSVLYKFGVGADGANPRAGIIADAQFNLYGTTAEGGPSYNGTVFRLSTKGVERILHKFSGEPDGALPEDTLLRLPSGDFVGTTYSGGTAGAGTIFEVSTKKNSYNVLFSFTGSATGSNPAGNLILDSAGNLYGTASNGGTEGAGAVFKLSPSNSETVLYNFKGGSDGSEPYGGLVRDKAGNLYGVTYAGGSALYGTIFKLAPDGTKTVLHNFSSTQTDGGGPYAGLIRDADGNLYGTTTEGGTYYQGTVFELSKNGTLTLLHSFSGADGSTPLAGVLRDKHGNLFGTASLGGNTNDGVVFEISP
jgi:uncharacterized repeat protein (TIGR03803 family)